MPLEGNESLSTRRISSNLRNYEAGRTGFFVLKVYGLNNLLPPDYTGDPAAAKPNNFLNEEVTAESLTLNVVKCPIPHFEVATKEYRRGNDVVKFAGVPTWTTGDIVVDDVVGLKTKSILLAWLYKAYNPHTRKGGRMVDYKKSADLYEYTQDYELVRTWHIEGIFITKLDEPPFDKENDDKKQITASFVYDRATCTDEE